MTNLRLVTAAEAAEALGVNTRTITRLAASGDLPTAKKLPGRTGVRLFREADVRALAAKRSVVTERAS